MMRKAIFMRVGNNLDPWDLIMLHRYDEAILVYNKILSKESGMDILTLANRATAFLCLGKVDEALLDFEKARNLDKKRSNKVSLSYVADIAVIYRLKEKKREAISILYSATEEVGKGNVEFLDAAGGVTFGLLLMYLALSSGDSAAYSHSSAYLNSLIKKSRSKNWPGPLARLVLNKIEFEEVLSQIFGSSDIHFLKNKAKDDLLIRRRLVKSIFYEGVKKLIVKDHEGFKMSMFSCNEMENPIIEPEWYLANYEGNGVRA